MTTVISFVVVLGILIFIHELGHFAMAKLCGVGVEKFSLGFGPKIAGFKTGETEYRLSLLPLGGYVKMVGESQDETVSDADRERSFTHKPIYKRAAIVVSGPVMNLILAVILMPIIYIIGIQVPVYLEGKPVVGYVEEGSAAWKAGIRKGDLLREVNGKSVKNWEALTGIILASPGNIVSIRIDREGKYLETELLLTAASDGLKDMGGLYPPMRPVIGAVSKGYPADKAGLQTGDTILSIDGIEVSHWLEVHNMIKGDGREKSIILERNGDIREVAIRPRWEKGVGGYLIGISPMQESIIKRYGLSESIEKGVKKSMDLMVLVFIIMKKLFLGELSIKTLGGPIMIAQVAGQAAETGTSAILSLMAFLSLQLGILNLFPFPVLDGGHLLFFGIEGLRGRPLNEKTMVIIQQVGIALLILLMVVVTYNDILRLFFK